VTPPKRPGLVERAGELLRLPGARIEMSGDDGCRLLHATFTRRHPRLRVVQNRRWGVALLRVPERFEDFLAAPERAHLRKQLKHARRFGFSFGLIDARQRLDEILAVNRSAEARQGEPMHPDYLDEARVRSYFERASDVFGVIGTDGTLRAYLCIRVCGDVAVVERLLGHGDALKQGVVWVLLAGAIGELSTRRQADGRPSWFMYDTILGATPGMRQFKEWVGFEPYRVSWSWSD
jgi:hypothetical protein